MKKKFKNKNKTPFPSSFHVTTPLLEECEDDTHTPQNGELEL